MNFDVAIVGSGLAGLSVALHLADRRKVVVISKRSLRDGASDWAQGGIAAVLDAADSHEQHVTDTLVAGAGLCDESATRFIISHGREAIEWLVAQGVPFTRDEQAALGLHLTREGGHSQRRISMRPMPPAMRYRSRLSRECASIRTSRCSNITTPLI